MKFREVEAFGRKFVVVSEGSKNFVFSQGGNLLGIIYGILTPAEVVEKYLAGGSRFI